MTVAVRTLKGMIAVTRGPVKLVASPPVGAVLSGRTILGHPEYLVGTPEQVTMFKYKHHLS